MLIKSDWGWEGKVKNVFHSTSCIEPYSTLFYSLLCNQWNSKESTSDLFRKCDLVLALGNSQPDFSPFRKVLRALILYMFFSTETSGNRTVNFNIILNAVSCYWAPMGTFSSSPLLYFPTPYLSPPVPTLTE